MEGGANYFIRKKGFRPFLCLLGLLSAFSLGGCADRELLTEILQTAAIGVEDGSETVKEGKTAGETSQEPEKTVKETGGQEAPEQEESFLEETSYHYAFDSLGEAEQKWYGQIAAGLGSMEQEVRLDKQGIEAGLDETSIDKIFQCVLIDHPELFYVEGYTYTKYNRGEKILSIRFSGTYSVNREQALARKSEIEEAVRPILKESGSLSSDYEKVKYVYETIIKSTEYDLNSPDNQNIYSVFVNHRSVCQGYAKAVQYLLDRMGVECVLVQGTVDTGEGHAWNLVKVNGSYYYVDATWGDASYQPEDGEMTGHYVPEINYDYLCVTTEQLLRTHILEGYIPLPVCTDVKDNYYVHENAYFTEYDRERMQSLFDRAFAEGRQEVTVKCSDTDCYWQILRAMTDDQEIFDYMKDNSDTVVYTHNEKQLSMTFWVTSE